MSDAMAAGSNGTMELALRGASQGASDARLAADRAAAAAALFASRFVYTTCYTIAYGIVFPSAMVARSVPRGNVAVRGLVDGSAAASRKVRELVNR